MRRELKVLGCLVLSLIPVAAAPGADETSSCRVCHGAEDSFLLGQGRILSSWLTGSTTGSPSHHLWVPRRDLTAVGRLPLVWQKPLVDPQESFFSRLETLRRRLETEPPSLGDAAAWEALLAEGSLEVPGFAGILWQPALARLRSGDRSGLSLCAANISKPFSRLTLVAGQRAVYRQVSQLSLAKMALFFGGSRKSYENELTVQVLGFTPDKISADLTLRDLQKGHVVTATAEIDGRGRVSTFVSNPPDHQRARNVAERWLKPSTDRLDAFTFQHELRLPPIAGRAVAPLILEVSVTSEGIEDYRGIPSLRGRADVREAPGQHMGLSGRSSFLVLPNGLTAHSDVDLRFAKRVKGFTARGHMKQVLELLLDASLLQP